MKYKRFKPSSEIYYDNVSEIDKDKSVYDFREKFINKYDRKSGIKPTLNPFKVVIFKSTKYPCDIYKAFYFRGFMISKKLLDILLKFNLPKYKIYNKIKYLSRGKIHDDYYYIHFYESLSDYLDFDESTFIWAPAKDRSYITNVIDGVHQMVVYEDNIKVKSFNDLVQKKQEKTKYKNYHLVPKELILKTDKVYDFVSMYYFMEHQYLISESLEAELIKNKIKGCSFSYPHYKIGFTSLDESKANTDD